MQEGLYARPEVSLGGCKSAADHYARGLERADATLAPNIPRARNGSSIKRPVSVASYRIVYEQSGLDLPKT